MSKLMVDVHWGSLILCRLTCTKCLDKSISYMMGGLLRMPGIEICWEGFQPSHN